ncbi:MAG: histidine kinase dimerization/phospho-acceptor domain-containing protein, partial [Bacillota bacterium]|nr:histidine kinase dimerization/phospho-acceptor domain-containing protein [Bacillota bacterium]
MYKRYKGKVNRHRIHHHPEEFRKFHRYIFWLRPAALLIPIILVYLMFRFIGVKSVTIFFALAFTAKEVIHLIIMLRLEKRIIKPVEKLKIGVEQIAEGNYEVRIESKVFNEIGILTDEFNKMAAKLNENEKLKQIYEENRKTLIANISHDLKTPITTVNGYIEALIDGVVTSPEKVDSYLKIIESNMTYMNN